MDPRRCDAGVVTGGMVPSRPRRRRTIAWVVVLGMAAGMAVASPAGAAIGYEQVSPVDKGGTEPEASLSTRAATGGNALHFSTRYSVSSVAPFGAPQQPSYLARRTERSWTTVPLDPPLAPLLVTAAVHTLTAGVSRDGTAAVVASSQVLAPGAIDGALNLYRRDLRTDTYVLIGVDDQQYSLGGMIGTPAPLLGMIIGSTANFDRVWLSLAYSGVRLTEDSGPGSNIYEWSVDDGLRHISKQPDGSPFQSAGVQYAEQPGATRNQNPVSDDGRQVVMVDVGGTGGLFVRRDGVTKAISYSRATGSSGDVVPLVVSAGLATTPDGRFTAFVVKSSELLTDDAVEVNGLYLYDREKPEAEQLTYIGGPGSGAGSPIPLLRQMSDDGRTIYFSTDDGSLHVWRDGTVRQVAASAGWGSNGHPTLALLDSATASDTAFQASPSGRYFAFPSVASLTGAPMRNPACASLDAPALDGYCPELFVYDAESQSITCASCADEGASRGSVGAVSAYRGTWGNEFRTRPMMFDSGRVLFDTPNALVPADTNASRDVYEYQGGQRKLISRGTPGTESQYLTAADDGASIFFVTDDPIVAQDTDPLRDVYVAGEGRGLPEQDERPEREQPCTGRDCRPGAPGRGDAPAPPSQDGGSGGVKAAPSRVGLRITVSSRVDSRRRVRVVVTPQGLGDGGQLRVSGRALRATTREVAGDGRVVLTVPLTKQALRTLQRRGRVAISVQVRVTPAVGAGKTVRVKKTVRSAR